MVNAVPLFQGSRGEDAVGVEEVEAYKCGGVVRNGRGGRAAEAEGCEKRAHPGEL